MNFLKKSYDRNRNEYLIPESLNYFALKKNVDAWLWRHTRFTSILLLPTVAFYSSNS